MVLYLESILRVTVCESLENITGKSLVPKGHVPGRIRNLQSSESRVQDPNHIDNILIEEKDSLTKKIRN